jgi:molybdopterin/thiamine biosynthesis adenylyltransferase
MQNLEKGLQILHRLTSLGFIFIIPSDQKTLEKGYPMDFQEPTDIERAIRQHAQHITDPAGREMDIISDGIAKVLAHQWFCKVSQVYLEALKCGIYPHRYIRNRAVISPEEQLKLAQSRVSVVGAGGLGGHIILLLGRIGVGHLVVIDKDVFDETNLNRQALCTLDSIGKPKADVAAAVMGSINPGVEVTAHHTRLDSSNMDDILSDSQAVVDALDNVDDRLDLNKETKKMNIPLVHGALAGFEGQVMTIYPEDKGLSLLYGEKGGRKDIKERPEFQLGVPTLTPAVVASFQAMEVVKLLLDRGQVFRDKMVYMDLEEGELRHFSLKGGT